MKYKMSLNSKNRLFALLLFSALILILINFSYSDTPVLKCEDYYGIISVNPNGTDQQPIRPTEAGCGYVSTITPDKKNVLGACRADNDLQGAYVITHIPACTGTVDYLVEAGKDIFGGMIESRKPLATTDACPGEITDYSSHIDLATQNIDVTVSFRNTGTNTCSYRLIIYGLEHPQEYYLENNQPLDWNEVASSNPASVGGGQSTTVTVSSTNTGPFGWLWDWLQWGWDANSLNGRIKVELRNTNNVLLDQIENAVCQDNVLVLCESNESSSLFLGNNVPVYGVVYQTDYLSLASYRINENQEKYWLLNTKDNTMMDMEDCLKTNAQTSQPDETRYYTIANNSAYNKYVKDTFGDEEFYNKYLGIYGENNTNDLYCYKTDLRNTSKCTEVNKLWYSFPDNTNGDLHRFMTPSYIQNTSLWNAQQSITELTPLEAGETMPNPGAMRNIMSEAFTITPLVQDVQGNSPWTNSGNGTFFGGA